MSESLIIAVTGEKSTARVLSLLGGCKCCPPCPPSRRISITFDDLPKGTRIIMSNSTATLSLLVTEKALGHLAYTDSTDPYVGASAVSDNPAIVVTQVDDASYFVGGDGTTEATGNVTFTDVEGNTIVVTVTTTSTPPPPVKTIGITFDAPVPIA